MAIVLAGTTTAFAQVRHLKDGDREYVRYGGPDEPQKAAQDNSTTELLNAAMKNGISIISESDDTGSVRDHEHNDDQATDVERQAREDDFKEDYASLKTARTTLKADQDKVQQSLTGGDALQLSKDQAQVTKDEAALKDLESKVETDRNALHSGSRNSSQKHHHGH